MATKKTPATNSQTTATTAKSVAKKEVDVAKKGNKESSSTEAKPAKAKKEDSSVKEKTTAKKTPAKKAAEPAKKESTPKVATPKKEETVKVAAKKPAAKKEAKEEEKKEESVPAKKAKAEPNAKEEKPTEKAKKETVKKAAAKKEVPAKPKRRKKQEFVPAPPMGKSEIIDAVRQKPRKNVNKPGQVIAIRSVEKEEQEEEVGMTMEKYIPEKRSVLDSLDDAKGPIYRYSDEELNEFREIINKRLERARKELNYLQGLITRKDEEGTEDTDNRFNHMEDGSAAMEREQVSQLAGRQVQFISHLENAMVRIENKTYGVCRVTGNLIDKARLRAVPHATLSIEAKKNLRRG